jgi:hypothetical protein
MQNYSAKWRDPTDVCSIITHDIQSQRITTFELCSSVYKGTT